jgi:anti-anti-sigma factor
MSQTELIRVRAEGAHKTVSFSPTHLDSVDSARQVAGHVSELLNSDRSETSQHSHLNLDFKNIDRLSSAWLNALIGINSEARNRGIRVVLLDVQQSVRDIFEVTRLERMFEFSSTVENA